MNHEFYQYYNNPDTNEHTFAFPAQQTNVNINHRTKSHKTTSNHANHVNRSQSAQQIHHKTHRKLTPNSTLTIPKQHSKSTGHGTDCDKPRLRDISSQESDTPMSSEFKKWSSKHKTHALRKAKSPLNESHHSHSHHPYDANPPPQYTPHVNKAAAASVSLNAVSAAAASRHATSSYPYPNGAKARQYYGNINNYIVDNHKRPRGRGSHGYQHSRDRSQQSQQSLLSFASTMSESAVTATTQLSHNNVSSTGSSEDLQKEHMMKQYVYTDYASPSPTLVTKTWQVASQQPQPPQPRTSRSRSQPGGIGGGYVLNNQSSHSTNASAGSLNFKQGTPMQGIGAMFYEIARHFESCIQYIIHHIPRQYIYAMNEDMVKFTLEFCGFDVENGKKFNPLFVQLQQHLKMQNINTTSSKINVFAYSGDKLLQYLRQCQDLLCSYINSPRNRSHSAMRDNLLSVFYSYYVKHGLSCMSVYALHSFYEVSHQYRLTQQQLEKVNEKLAVVKNLFTDDLKHLEPAAPSALTTDYKPPQQSMAPQISAPVSHHQLQAKPINHSKSHPELAAHHQNNKIIERHSDDIGDDLESDEFKMEDGGESTPVLSDINDIDRHLSSQNGLAPALNEYDSDMQSEMSATPQPADIQNAMIQQFVPNAIATLNSSSIPNMSIQAIKEEPKLNEIQCEISNDADDEVSSPGSMSTSTDNDTVGGSGIKTLTPTPHKPNNIDIQRSSQIIIPSPVEHLRSIKVHKMTPTVKKVRKKGNKRQSWTDIAMEKIDVYVSHDANNREFKMMQPINQQQGVQNMIKEYRKSLGQNELKDTLEVLRKEFDGDADEDEDEEEEEEEEDIIDVNEQSDDEFFDDEELRAAQAKYMSFNGQSIANKPKLDTADSNDTTSSRQVLKENAYQNNQISKDYTKKIIHEESNAVHGSRNRRGSSNKSNSNHSKHSQHSSHRSHRSNQSSSNHSKHSHHSKHDRDREDRNKLESQYGILSNSTTRSNKRNRRSSDSETGRIRKFTNDTTPSTHRPMQPNHGHYEYSNNSAQSQHRQDTDRRLEMKYYHSNSSHSRSSSDFIGSHNLSYKPPPNGNANNQRYNYQFGAVYDVEEQSDNNSAHSSARKYQKKKESKSGKSASRSPKANGSRKKLRRVITAKHEQIRSNYMVRAQYVDRHQSFKKYASDRNASWKKWIKLLQSHDSDITNVSSLAQVQALIDFARMSLGNFGNWLMMKSENSNWNKSKAKQWTRYFAIMRDFNLFLLADSDKYIPSTLDDVVNAEYLALSVAHIENVRQCAKNECELYLEVTGSKSSHKLKFRCESTEACRQWVAEMNYQIHIVSDLCCNQSLRLECADQKKSIWIPVAPLSKVNPYSITPN